MSGEQEINQEKKLMHRTLIALALAASTAFTALPTSAIAMEDEHNMLVGSVYNALRQFGIQTDNIDQLTLHEVVVLKNLLSDSSMAEAQKRTQIEALLEDE